MWVCWSLVQHLGAKTRKHPGRLASPIQTDTHIHSHLRAIYCLQANPEEPTPAQEEYTDSRQKDLLAQPGFEPIQRINL